MEKTKGAVWNDLELYFYLYREGLQHKKKWELVIETSYLDRARVDKMSFEIILEDYCLDRNIHIYDRRITKRGAMLFYLEIKDRSIPQPKDGIYDTCLTTKRQY